MYIRNNFVRTNDIQYVCSKSVLSMSHFLSIMRTAEQPRGSFSTSVSLHMVSEWVGEGVREWVREWVGEWVGG